ncbi:hypothetical protein MMC26_002145 [Xylographa opegraphella]|nr:hypothetical protein [Xylographa opegraphella]
MSSSHLLHQCRHLNSKWRFSPFIDCTSLAFLDDSRRASRTYSYFASAIETPKDEDITAIQDAGVSLRDALNVSQGQRKPADKNIFVDDLQATLEAHRAANRAKYIRKVKIAPAMGLGLRNLKLRPDQEPSSRTGKPNIKSNEEVTPGSDSSTHDSIEMERNTHDLSRLSSKHQSPTNQSLEHKGRYRVVQGQWQRRQAWYSKKLRRATSQDNKSSDSQPRLSNSHVTDAVEVDEHWRPWIDYVESGKSDGMLRLGEEIRAFERFMKPTSDEEQSTQAAITLTQSTVAAVAPKSMLTMHGSRYTGIASPLSDIDFSVSLPEYEKDSLKRGPSIHRPEARRGGATLLRKIEKALIKSPRYEHVNFIFARVNLVVAVDVNTQLALQFQTLASFMPAREYSMHYLSEFPGLRPLYVLLRHFLFMRGFSTARDGGVGSYSLLIMIVTAFKHSRQTFAPESLALELLHVLKFWSTADLYAYGYAANPPMSFTKTPPKMSLEEREERLADPVLRGIDFIRKPNEDMPFLLCLQDPGNPTNDLGKRITQIKDIQACFTTGRRNLIYSLKRWETMVEFNEHQKGPRYSFLDCLVGADYSIFLQQRRHLANAHKEDDKVPFSGQKRLNLKAIRSLPASKTKK